MSFQVGDFCKRKMSAEEAQLRADQDIEKARKRGRHAHHVGNAATYLHTNQAYRIEEIRENGGLRLKGFTLVVASDEVIPASRNEIRQEGLRWGRA